MLTSATTPSSSSSSASARFASSSRPHRTASARGRRLRPVLAMAASDDPRAAPARSVAVVGAGVSGLVAAYRLRKSGVRVTVFEADDRAGGKIRTNSDSGFLWDEGANTMTESALEASRLIDDLGLEDRLQYPNSQHKRYTVKDGAPALIPSDPIALMKSSLLSKKSKFKLFLEPFLYEKSSTKNSKKVSDEHLSESVGSFFERHFGKEVVDYLIDPFVAGTSAGDPESLSIRHAFPGLWNLEKNYCRGGTTARSRVEIIEFRKRKVSEAPAAAGQSWARELPRFTPPEDGEDATSCMSGIILIILVVTKGIAQAM